MADYKLNTPYPLSFNGVDPYPLAPDKSKPLPPTNVFVTTPYITGILDIRWDNPLDVPENSQWKILGVNIYRSYDSEGGEYHLVNQSPIEGRYYRDMTNNIFVMDEDVTPRLRKGVNAPDDWMFTTLKKPIVKESSQAVLADSVLDVIIKVDNNDGKGKQNVPPFKVNGRTGEVFLITKPIYNPNTKKFECPLLPTNPNAKVYASYWYNMQLIRTDLYPRNFYKVTTVGRDNFGNIFETALKDIRASNVHQLEKPHYVWKSIIVKNRYLLEQLGERCKLFIRKEVGEQCPNYSDVHGQSHYNCELCFGTGILGGYYGVYDILIAPPEAEKHIDLTDAGLRLNFLFESWTGPSPLVRTRDFIVRQNGERMAVGAVTPQGGYGAVFQQHFTLNYKDSKDIIYKVPMDGSNKFTIPQSDDTRGVNQPITEASPLIPEYKSERADTDKGRTIDYENVTW